MSRSDKFNTMVSFRCLLEKQISKNTRRPLKTAKEVLMLVDAILYDVNSFDAFYNFSDNVNVYLHIDDKRKIQKISISA